MATIDAPSQAELHAAGTDEAQPGLSPRLMKYTDIPTAIRTGDAAFKDSPFRHYLRDTPDFQENTAYQMHEVSEGIIMWNYWVTASLAWTIDNGASYVAYGTAKSAQKMLDKALFTATVSVVGLEGRLVLTKQQKERGEKFARKHKIAMQEALGERLDEAVNLRLLATAPDKQGRGYASALVRIVTGIADAQGRATVLTSSNIVNTKFYNSLGFIEKAKIILGDDDDTWQEPPITLLVGANIAFDWMLDLDLQR